MKFVIGHTLRGNEIQIALDDISSVQKHSTNGSGMVRLRSGGSRVVRDFEEFVKNLTEAL